MKIRYVVLTTALLASVPAFSADKTVTINTINETGIGKPIGTIKFSDSDNGLVITANLNGLAPGLHGFHVHDKASCEAGEKDGVKTAGLGAGGHFDPDKTMKHEGPMGHGHTGDLPALQVDEQGNAVDTLLAPRLKLADITGHAIIIHAGGDNYSDDPKPLGGGGARLACGII